MAIPAANSMKQRYTAGSCVLEVASQPSALSQWSDRLVSSSLTFKLWLGNDTADSIANGTQGTRRLVAEGDGTALQSITQYIQARTRQALAVSALGGLASRDSTGRRSSGVPSSSDSSDSSSTHTGAYPPEFKYPQPLSYLQLCDLNTVLGQYEQTTVALPLVASERLSENVVLLQAVRDQRADQSTNLARFPRKLRKRMGLRAGSAAAAALAAVGLTTVLWSRESTLQQMATSDNVPISAEVSEPETVQSLEQAQADGILSDSSLDAPSDSSPNSSLNSSLSDEATQSAEALSEDAESDASSNVLSGQTPQPPRTPERLANDSTVPFTDDSATLDPSSSASQALTAVPSPTPSEVGPARNRTDILSTTPSPATSTFGISPPAEQSEVVLGTDELEGQSAPAADFDPAENEAIVRSDTDDSARSAATEVPNGSPSEFLQQPAPIVGEVQTYFQQRWRGGSQDILLYELRLSATGNVVSFTAVNEAAEQQRERVFPNDAPPFATSSAGDSLTLRVILSGDGTVQVIETK